MYNNIIEMKSKLQVNSSERTEQTLKLEQAFLGGLLANKNSIFNVKTPIQDYHFYEPLHQELFKWIDGKKEKGEVITGLIAQDAFKDNNTYKEIKHKDYFLSLEFNEACEDYAINDYAELIINHWGKREFVKKAQNAINKTSEDFDLEEISNELETDLLRIKKGREIKVINPTPFEWVEPETIQPRQWIYGKFLMRGIVSGLIASGGVGKSSLSIAIGLSMVSGKTLLHDTPKDNLKVWLWNGEDSQEELTRRIIATCKHYKLKQDDIKGRLFFDSGLNQEIIIAEATRQSKAQLNNRLIEQIKDKIISNKIDLMVIDPFVSSHRVEENDNGAIDLVVKTWAKIAQDCNCSILLVHHISKTGGSAATAESARGASSFIGALRACWVLNPMTDELAESYGIENPAQYVAINNAKANLALRESKAKWLKLEGVSLENNRSHNLNEADFVGVVSKWTPPDPFDDMTVEDLENCKEAIRQGEYKESPQANNWVGHIIGSTIGKDSESKAGKKEINRIIKTWIASGELKIIRKPMKDKGREAPFVIVADKAEIDINSISPPPKK